MQVQRRINIFTDKYPLLGPLIWVLCIKYFASQLFVAAAWTVGYSWRHNLISDLGNTACGQYAGRFVCSPEHALMNASFIMLGVTMALGSLLIYTEFRQTRASFYGFTLMALAGLGTFVVGVFPENTIAFMHGLGALFGLAVGNVSLVVLALALQRVRTIFRIYTFVSGIVSLIAFALFIGHVDFGLGSGGMERLLSYPKTIWLVMFCV
jgi:hypothetical membrane protein